MNLAQEIKQAISAAENSLSERELKDHKKLRTSMTDILKWLQARKVGFLIEKPTWGIEENSEYIPRDLFDYLQSIYCQQKQILIPYSWDVDCKSFLDTGENRNFWKTVERCLSKSSPQAVPNPVCGLGSPNTWERGRD